MFRLSHFESLSRHLFERYDTYTKDYIYILKIKNNGDTFVSGLSSLSIAWVVTCRSFTSTSSSSIMLYVQSEALNEHALEVYGLKAYCKYNLKMCFWIDFDAVYKFVVHLKFALNDFEHANLRRTR